MLRSIPDLQSVASLFVDKQVIPGRYPKHMFSYHFGIGVGIGCGICIGTGIVVGVGIVSWRLQERSGRLQRSWTVSWSLWETTRSCTTLWKQKHRVLLCKRSIYLKKCLSCITFLTSSQTVESWLDVFVKNVQLYETTQKGHVSTNTCFLWKARLR
jgi:hypothetical protein